MVAHVMPSLLSVFFFLFFFFKKIVQMSGLFQKYDCISFCYLMGSYFPTDRSKAMILMMFDVVRCLYGLAVSGNRAWSRILGHP